jgi:CheY-like chemotaxis protein
MSRQSGSPVHLNVVGDGEQAMHFLRRAGAFADAPRRGLIVLDLNLPRRTGLEVLADLKADRDLLVIPVLILTTSAAPADPAQLFTARQRLYHQARRLRQLHRRDQPDRQLVPASHQAPAHLVTRSLRLGRPPRGANTHSRESMSPGPG